MTDHPITPSPMLVAKLWREASAGRDDAPIGEIFSHGVYLAYRAGADQELEACCELMDRDFLAGPSDLRAARRPKPQTLKSISLQMLGTIERDGYYIPETIDTIRRALEQLPE